MTARVQLRQLAYFVEVARNGSIGKAAEALQVSQPAVTRTIKELEEALGLILFARSKTGIVLTRYGKTFLEHASVAVAEVNAGILQLDALKSSAQGRVIIGGLQVTMSNIIPMAVARLKRARPLVNVTILPGTDDQLLPALKRGEIDIVFGRRGAAEQMAGLNFDVLFQDRLVLAARHDHPLAQRKNLQLVDMLDFPWIVPLPHTLTRESVKRTFREGCVDFPRNCIEGPFGLSTLVYMAKTDAIAALPDNLISDEVAMGRVCLLMADPNWVISDCGITHRDNALLSEPTRMLMLELKRVATRRRREAR